MTNHSRRDKIYPICPPKQLAKILIALGLFFALLPLVPRDYGLASNQKERTENIIGKGRDR